jgi:antitoxin component YwqK of YwqJK toxin-antitoxin module
LKCYYKNDMLHGEFIKRYSNGNLYCKKYYDHDVKINKVCYHPNGKEKTILNKFYYSIFPFTNTTIKNTTHDHVSPIHDQE